MATTPQRVMDLLREEIPARISLNQFCKKTGINPNSVDKYMAGVAEPNLASLSKIAFYFDVSISYLIEESVIERFTLNNIWDKILSGYEALLILGTECYDELAKDAFLLNKAREIAHELVTMPEDKRVRFNKRHYFEVKKLAAKFKNMNGEEYILSQSVDYYDTLKNEGGMNYAIEIAHEILNAPTDKKSIDNKQYFDNLKSLAERLLEKHTEQ